MLFGTLRADAYLSTADANACKTARRALAIRDKLVDGDIADLKFGKDGASERPAQAVKYATAFYKSLER
jgi:hypothetical protein